MDVFFFFTFSNVGYDLNGNNCAITKLLYLCSDDDCDARVERNVKMFVVFCTYIIFQFLSISINPFTASCENAMSLSVPGVSASCEKFPHSSQ
jgi:hypothetical protein